MNIFSALVKIVKAANQNYRETQEDKMLHQMKQEAIIQERRSKALLKEQIEELLEVINIKGYTGIQIAIAKECEPYLEEVMFGMEAEITPLPNGEYLLESKEVLLT